MRPQVRKIDGQWTIIINFGAMPWYVTGALTPDWPRAFAFAEKKAYSMGFRVKPRIETIYGC
jgi:hypothetical protein